MGKSTKQGPARGQPTPQWLSPHLTAGERHVAGKAVPARGRAAVQSVGQQAQPVSVKWASYPFCGSMLFQGLLPSMSPTPGTLPALHWAGPQNGLLDTASFFLLSGENDENTHLCSHTYL